MCRKFGERALSILIQFDPHWIAAKAQRNPTTAPMGAHVCVCMATHACMHARERLCVVCCGGRCAGESVPVVIKYADSAEDKARKVQGHGCMLCSG